jgi:AraC family transcriptional regulator
MICYDGLESRVPEGYHRPAVPALTWAALPTMTDSPVGTGEQVQGLWKRTFSEWFPSSGYERAECPELGMYFGIDGNKHNDCAGIWIPVAGQ